jgi:hypothetical protein
MEKKQTKYLVYTSLLILFIISAASFSLRFFVPESNYASMINSLAQSNTTWYTPPDDSLDCGSRSAQPRFNKNLNDDSFYVTYDFVKKNSWDVSKNWVNRNIKPLNSGVATFLNSSDSQNLLNKLISTMANYYLCQCEYPRQVNVNLINLQGISIENANYALSKHKNTIKYLNHRLINTVARLTRNGESKRSTTFIILQDMYSRGDISPDQFRELIESSERKGKRLLRGFDITLDCDRAKKLNPDYHLGTTAEDLISAWKKPKIAD